MTGREEVLRRYEVVSPALVIEEAKLADLRIAHALALLEKETGIPQQNIFGCDHGPGVAFCHKRVTRRRVRKLLKSPYSNGVGWTQLTYKPFVQEAQRLGGAHKPRYQMRVGFALLASLIDQYGVQQGFRRYNGSGPDAEEYGWDAVQKVEKWERRLQRG